MRNKLKSFISLKNPTYPNSKKKDIKDAHFAYIHYILKKLSNPNSKEKGYKRCE
jgi:hypothetical protein